MCEHAMFYSPLDFAREVDARCENDSYCNSSSNMRYHCVHSEYGWTGAETEVFQRRGVV